jgi:hypothetical protein
MSDRGAGLGIDYDVPAGFDEGEADGVVIVGEPNNEIGFFIKRLGAAQADQAVAELDALLSQLFHDVQTSGAPVQGTHRDMPATDVQATGTFQGQPCLISVRWLKPSTEALVVVISAVLTAKKGRWQETADTFLQSIRRAA